MGVIGKLQNDEYLIYIFTGKFQNGTWIIFHKTIYHCWYKYLRNHFSPVIINTTHKNIHFFNQINGEIPGSGVIYEETINPRDLCYQFSKDGPDFLFGKLKIRYSIYEPYFPAKIKVLSIQIQMNTLFHNNDERKRRVCDRNIHKAMKIPVKICQTNKKVFCYSSTKKCM